MKSYVIKLEDKAAFTNVCMSKGIEFKEGDFKTDKINDTFSFEIVDDEKEKAIDDILKQHPDIEVLKRSKMNEMLLMNIIKTLK
jgi:hypothetical protein